MTAPAPGAEHAPPMFPKDVKGWVTLFGGTLAGGISGWLHAGGPDFTVIGVHGVLALALVYLAMLQTPASAMRRIADLEAKLGVPRAPRPPSIPLAMLMLALMCAALVVVLMAALAACIPNAQGQVQDGIALEQCVQDNWGKPFATVVLTCAPNEEQAVADVIADIVVFLDTQSDGGGPSALASTPYVNEPKVIAALPLARKKAAQAR
ncbi:MAG TPA: hypothetical protein VGR59_09580 [Gemmatimonadaceae bacterium]|nr:hypothetical protein [Gemmatimonadaceae bacterium]